MTTGCALVAASPAQVTHVEATPLDRQNGQTFVPWLVAPDCIRGSFPYRVLAGNPRIQVTPLRNLIGFVFAQSRISGYPTRVS
jgi:hypothetical protein